MIIKLTSDVNNIILIFFYTLLHLNNKFRSHVFEQMHHHQLLRAFVLEFSTKNTQIIFETVPNQEEQPILAAVATAPCRAGAAVLLLLPAGLRLAHGGSSQGVDCNSGVSQS